MTGHDCLVIAVSGGADSMALLTLVADWAKRQTQPPNILAATIDHGLRPESAAEAAMVARYAASLDLPHRIGVWTGDKPNTGLQAAARVARYDLLARLALDDCRAAGCSPRPVRGAIVTAHTADDLAETLLMRLMRGSGVDGLAGIPARGAWRAIGPEGLPVGVPLLRPLLDVPRDRLRATVAARAVPFVDDPSNLDPRFERVRVRQALTTLAALGLTRDAVVRTANRVQSARLALQDATDTAWRRCVMVEPGILLEVDLTALRTQPLDIAVRLLRRALTTMRGGDGAAELSAVEALAERLRAESVIDKPVTLAGCIIQPMRKAGRTAPTITIFREPDRPGTLPTIALAPGQSAIWDARFRVQIAAGHSGTVEVSALGRDRGAFEQASDCLARSGFPIASFGALPCFRSHGHILAVPALAKIARDQGDIAMAALWSGPACHASPPGDRGQSHVFEAMALSNFSGAEIYER